MATSATAIADVFSPTYATSTAPTASVSSSSTASGLTNPPAVISYTPTASVYGSSGGTSTGTVGCAPCCGGASGGGGFLPAWFGPNGLCPGAVDNSVPVTVWATFLLEPKLEYITQGGFEFYYPLGNDCLSSTNSSVQMIADDYLYPNRLRFVNYQNACQTSYPSTSFSIRSGFIEVGNNFLKSGSLMDKERIQPVNIVICRCGKNEAALLASSTTTSLSDNYSSLVRLGPGTGVNRPKCSPFFQFFGPYESYPYPLSSYSHLPGVIWTSSGVRGYWAVSFTL